MQKPIHARFSLRALLLASIVIGSLVGFLVMRAQRQRFGTQAMAVKKLIEKAKVEHQDIDRQRERASIALNAGREAILGHLFALKNGGGIRDGGKPESEIRLDQLNHQLDEFVNKLGEDHRQVRLFEETIREWENYFEIQQSDPLAELDLKIEPERVLQKYINNLEGRLADLEIIINSNNQRLIRFQEMSYFVE